MVMYRFFQNFRFFMDVRGEGGICHSDNAGHTGERAQKFPILAERPLWMAGPSSFSVDDKGGNKGVGHTHEPEQI